MSNKLAQRVHFVSTPPAGEDFLQQLRRVNGERWKEWAQSDNPDPLYMSNEFGGEAGEVQNVVKKLVRESRGWKGSRASVAQLGDEIADCIICLDSLARAYGLHLPEIISAKFNATSEANGFEHRLGVEGIPSRKCGMCDDTGYKDYAGFAMDPCDHQPAPVADTEKLLPANPAALERSIASVDAFMDSDDGHMLTPEHGESIMLCMHELKRLRSLPDQAGDEPVAMTAEEHRLEDLKQMAAYAGPIVSFEVREPYYLASCDHCGWVGSSELCGTDSFGDDSDVYCPRCGTSGADFGKVAGRIPSAQGNPESLHDKARSDAEAILGRLRAGGYRASIANVEKLAKHVLKLTAAVAPSAEPAGENLDHEALIADKARLDYLDRCNAALNAQYGTNYSWKLIQSHNVNRLMLGGEYDVDLNDSQPNGLPSCRDAIDERMRNSGRAVA